MHEVPEPVYSFAVKRPATPTALPANAPTKGGVLTRCRIPLFRLPHGLLRESRSFEVKVPVPLIHGIF